jgi:putative regulator of septum formation
MLLAAGDAPGAESVARRLIGLDPYVAPGHVLLVFALIGQDRAAEAREEADRATALFPQDAQSYVALSAAWLADGKAVEGEAWARRALEIDPGSADAHFVLGTALDMRSKKDEAQREYDQAINLEPGHASAAERVLNSARAPIVAAVGIVAFLTFQALRILGGRFTDRIVAVLLLVVTAAFVLAVLVGLRLQRRRLARLTPYARLIVGLHSNRRWSAGLGQLGFAVVIITAVVIALTAVTVLYATGEKSALQVQVGDCFSLDANVSFDKIAVIPCQLPHDIEVFAVLADPSAAGSPFPGLDALRATLLPRCEALYPAYVGVPFDRNAPAQIRPFMPEEPFWVLDIRTEFCGLSSPTGRQLVGSLRATH